jgi:hypothetical protein
VDIKKLINTIAVIGVTAGMALSAMPANANHLQTLAKSKMKHAGLRVTDVLKSLGSDLKLNYRREPRRGHIE